MFILFGHAPEGTRALSACQERTFALFFGAMPRVTEEHLAARRRQILDAALACFSRRGFHQTSMQDIFDESGLSPGAVYRYFKSKEEIVEAIAMETLGGFAAAVESGPPGAPSEVLARLFDAVDAVPSRDQRMRLALQIWGEAVVNPRIGGFVGEAIERLRGRVAAELLVPDPDATASAIVALLQGMVVQRDIYGDRFDSGAFREAALALVSQPDRVSRQEG
jgi:TetR/AcrR family transcriptional regulator, transcriptional repressor of aconitase